MGRTFVTIRPVRFTLECSLSLHQPFLRQRPQRTASWLVGVPHMSYDAIALTLQSHHLFSSFGASPSGALHPALVCVARSPRGCLKLLSDSEAAGP